MELCGTHRRRCVGGGTPFILPLMFTQLLAVMFFSGAASEAGRHFHCYYTCNNDIVFCQFTPPNGQTNCSEYTMNITPIDDTETQAESCRFKYGDGPAAECKCSLKYLYISIRDKHTATLLIGGQKMMSIVVNRVQSLKPQAPTITVNPSGTGTFKVTWDTHCSKQYINKDLIALVTYGKKGDSAKISRYENSTHSTEMRELDPSSVYVVTVRTTYLNRSLLSDSSNEEEFTTSPSARTRLNVLIIGLCIAVVIVSCTALCCYAKYKAKYWDNIPKCYSNLLTMVPASKQMFLQPPQPIISSVYLDSAKTDGDEDKQWSEVFIDDGNHQESYGSTTEPSSGRHGNISPDNGDIMANVHAALRQALPHLTVTSSETDGDYGGNDSSPMSQALSFDNRGYTSGQNDTITSGSYATQTRPESDPTTPVDLVTSQRGPNLQLGPSSSTPMHTHVSYQPCHADSGTFSRHLNLNALILNGSDVCARAEADGYESFGEAVSGGHSVPPEEEEATPPRLSPDVDMDYQAFPNQVTQLGPSWS